MRKGGLNSFFFSLYTVIMYFILKARLKVSTNYMNVIESFHNDLMLYITFYGTTMKLHYILQHGAVKTK